MSGTHLIGDIGGTFARFAIAEPGARALTPDTMMVAGLATLEDAIAQFLELKGVQPKTLAGAALCAAGPVREDGTIHMTNCPWLVDPAFLKGRFGFPFVRVLNDFTANAMGLPRLGAEGVEQIGGDHVVEGAAKGILGPGTGFGVSGLIPCGDGKWQPLASEGGHVDLAPHDDRQIAVIFHILRTFGHASPERVLSGPGLETLFEALCALDGASPGGKLSAVDITNAARKGDALALEATDMFASWLGSVAGDLALTLGARGGIYLAGGILPQWGDLFDRARFRRGFEAKGRFRDYLAPIPAFLVTRKDLALLGCLEAARNI